VKGGHWGRSRLARNAGGRSSGPSEKPSCIIERQRHGTEQRFWSILVIVVSHPVVLQSLRHSRHDRHGQPGPVQIDADRCN